MSRRAIGTASHRRTSFGPSVLLVLLMLIAWNAPQASAAPSKFVQQLCDSALPKGNSPAVSFVVNPGVPIGWFDTCAQPGGSIGLSQWGQTSSTFAYLSVAVPATPGGYVESESISAAACGLGPGNDNTFVFTQGWPANCAGESQRTFPLYREVPIFGGGGGFTILLNCNGNYAPGCAPGPVIWARRITVTHVDPKPPRLTAPTGSLLAGGVLRGRQSIAVDATDTGGGLTRIDLTVNGLPAGPPVVGNCNLAQVDNPGRVGSVALTPTPCPTKLAGSWTLDTATYPFQNGDNSVQVCAADHSDLTEPNRTCTAPVTVKVDNSCTESPVPGGETISASFKRTRGEKVTVPYNQPANVVGELVSRAGDAISGATVCVLTQTQGSRGRPRPIAAATTDANGRFAYKVPPGPNRKVLVGYRHDSFQVAKSLRYFARARPTIEIRPGRVAFRGEIRIRGKLPGGRRAAGRVVVLQASALHSKRWYPFREVTTNRHGVYRARYRLDATRQTITYRIRAVAPRQRNYPWEKGHSKPALVEVRG